MADLVIQRKSLSVELQFKFFGHLPKENICNKILKVHCFILSSNYGAFGS